MAQTSVWVDVAKSRDVEVSIGSKARVQQCIWCNGMVVNTWVHVFGSCQAWCEKRDIVVRTGSLRDMRSWDVMYAVVCQAKRCIVAPWTSLRQWW